MNLNHYDTIIFDFGGVILNIDINRTINQFVELFGKQVVDNVINKGILQKYERGQISTKEFYNTICTETNKRVSESDFIKAWNAMLLDYNKLRLDKIKQLSKTHKLILLSNTNEEHFTFFSRKLYDEFGLTFNDLFSSLYLSYKLHLLKPDVRIFQTLIENENLQTHKTLFIEDTLKNAQVAEKLGINTLVIEQNHNFYEYF